MLTSSTVNNNSKIHRSVKNQIFFFTLSSNKKKARSKKQINTKQNSIFANFIISNLCIGRLKVYQWVGSSSDLLHNPLVDLICPKGHFRLLSMYHTRKLF